MSRLALTFKSPLAKRASLPALLALAQAYAACYNHATCLRDRHAMTTSTSNDANQRLLDRAKSGDAVGMGPLLAAERGHLECARLLWPLCNPRSDDSSLLRMVAEDGHAGSVKTLISSAQAILGILPAAADHRNRRAYLAMRTIGTSGIIPNEA